MIKSSKAGAIFLLAGLMTVACAKDNKRGENPAKGDGKNAGTPTDKPTAWEGTWQTGCITNTQFNPYRLSLTFKNANMTWTEQDYKAGSNCEADNKDGSDQVTNYKVVVVEGKTVKPQNDVFTPPFTFANDPAQAVNFIEESTNGAEYNFIFTYSDTADGKKKMMLGDIYSVGYDGSDDAHRPIRAYEPEVFVKQ
jgi:hypothetical protein